MAEADIYRAHNDLLIRYCHALDTRDWDLLAKLFAEDAVFTARVQKSFGVWEAEAIRLTSGAAIVRHISETWAKLSATHHMLGNILVEPAADGLAAKGSAYVRAYHVGAGERSDLFEESFARFDFETARMGAAWRIRTWDEKILIMLGTPAVFGH